MKRVIKAANETKGEEAFNETLSDIQDDFDYFVDGLDKMSRDGNTSEALRLTLEAKEAINSLIDKISLIGGTN